MHSLVVDDWCALAVNITDSISVAMLLDNACWRYQLHASNSSCHVIHAASHSNRRSQIVSARWGLSNVDRTWCNGYFNFVLLHKVCSLSLKARCAILKARMCIVNLVVLWNTITGAAKKNNVSNTKCHHLQGSFAPDPLDPSGGYAPDPRSPCENGYEAFLVPYIHCMYVSLNFS